MPLHYIPFPIFICVPLSKSNLRNLLINRNHIPLSHKQSRNNPRLQCIHRDVNLIRLNGRELLVRLDEIPNGLVEPT